MTPHKKRLVFCFDGTWNRLEALTPTNVVLTAQSVLPRARDGDIQVVYYDEGVGTATGERALGGIFGAGLLKNLSDAYRALIFNHTPGDEIYIFGFSRGAFTARSFAGLISAVGIVDRKSAARANDAVALYRARATMTNYAEATAAFRAKCSSETCVSENDDAWRVKNVSGYTAGTAPQVRVRYLGVWDTVGALGIPRSVMPFEWVRRKYRFHNHALSSFVEHARHAVALDERRTDFGPTLWNNVEELNRQHGADSALPDAPYQQRWFPGTHGGVGGGGDRRGLSDAAIEWIWDGARAAGLELDLRIGSPVFGLMPDHTEYLDNVSALPGVSLKSIKSHVIGFIMGLHKTNRSGPTALYQVDQSARRKWKDDPKNLRNGVVYRPASLTSVSSELDALDAAELGVELGGAPNSESYELWEVKEGDTLSKIARQKFGDAEQWPRIFAVNKYKVSDPDRIYVGQTLRIPQFS